jgi:hypothetical protein
MTQPSTPAPAPGAPQAPTTITPPTPAPGAPTPPAGTPAPPQPQPAWPQPPAGYQQMPPVQYMPVMPLPTTAPTPQQPAEPAAGTDGGESDLAKLPQWAQRQIQSLRDENAKRRVSERTALVNQHAWAAAQQLGANAQAMLGSLAWQQAAEGLDPNKADFGRHLSEAIWRTIQQNPWMAAQQPMPQQPAPGQPGVPGQQPPPGQPGQQPPQPGAPGQQPPAPPVPPYPPQPYPAPTGYPPVPPAWPPQPYGYLGYPPAYPPQQPPAPSGAEFAAGNGATAPITEAQLAQMTPQQIDEAYRAGKLKHLM